MRSSHGLISLLIVVALIMFFFARKATRDFDSVRTVTLTLPQNAEPRPFDAQAAGRLARRLRELLVVADLPADELQQASGTAASWVAGARPGTAHHHTAVKLHSAAVELASASTSLEDPHRVAARRHLDDAGSPHLAAPDSGAGPANPIHGIRDQMENLQTTQKERFQHDDRNAH